MGRIPQTLRDTIARNIRECRLEKFPGRSGKICAEAFSEFIGKKVSPQQWSPWERGMRTPDESHLAKIAAFFGKSVEYMRRDNRPPGPNVPPPQEEMPQRHMPNSPDLHYAAMSMPELIMAMHRNGIKAIYQVEISVSAVRFIPSDTLGSAWP